MLNFPDDIREPVSLLNVLSLLSPVSRLFVFNYPVCVSFLTFPVLISRICGNVLGCVTWSLTKKALILRDLNRMSSNYF